MRFTDVALAHDMMSRGSKTGFPGLNREEAISLYQLLFPQRTLTRRRLVSEVAKQLMVPYDVLSSLGEDASALLASESSASNQSTWTIEEALSVRRAVVDGEFSFLSLSKQMNEIDARFFWRSVMGDRMAISKSRYLKSVVPTVPPDVVSSSRGFLTDMEVLSSLYGDQSILLDPRSWNEKPNSALRPRRWLPWSRDVPVEMTHYQEIPKGKVTLDYNEEKKVIVERVQGIVTDVAYPNHPDLNIKDRLTRYSESSEEEIAWPTPIPSWESMVKKEGTIRFPNEGGFSPAEYGGYVLVKDHHIHSLRLSAYRHMSGLEMQAQALDGIDDFIEVGNVCIELPSKRASVSFDLERMLGTKTSEEDQWEVIPDDTCIVIDVASPFLDRRTGLLSEPVFMRINHDSGVSDITQYVDLVGSDAD